VDAAMTTVEDDADLDRLLELIFERYHYDFRSYARASLRRRVGVALTRIGVRSVDELTTRIADDNRAFGELLPWFTVQLSDLFRDPEYFKHFREHIVPILRTYASRKLWVAGCSTGEEAYSFAIILREEDLLERTLIYATDIYEQSLRTAESGVYELDRMRTFTENHRKSGGKTSLSEHYSTTPNGAMFDKGLREHIVFADHSLATDAVFAEVQVVSCRNVLIYFASALQSRAIGLFSDSLVRNGWLGLGPKETLEFSTEKHRFVPHPQRWYEKREAR
jgi:chemotaxis protein methyltransferase CheR